MRGRWIFVSLIAVVSSCTEMQSAQSTTAVATTIPTTTTPAPIGSVPVSTTLASPSTTAPPTTVVGTTIAAATTTVTVAPTATVVPAAPPTSALPAQPVVENRVIGMSVGGRAIVAMHKPGSDHATRRILVVGQMHGEESAGKGVVATLVAMHIPESVDLWMITTMNPDGGVIGRRTNNNGVDLNRNFPAHWEAAGGPNTSAEHNSGSGPGSEPETQAAMAFIASIHPDVSIWYHQPYHWLDCDLSVAASVCNAYATRVGYSVTHEVLPGTVIDWEAQHGYGVAFVVEFGYGTASAASLARHAAAAVSV